MIVYQATKKHFLHDILSNDIDGIILKNLFQTTGRKVGKQEISSWKFSLMHMSHVLYDEIIPMDSGITIEYQIPQTSKRIDFIITGQNENNIDHVVLIELKQWQKAQLTEKDGVVITRFQNGESEVNHPSYQAWSYSALLNGFNETVYEENIQLKPCAYLHNYENDSVITNEFYSEYIKKAPLFLKPDAEKLQSFIKKYIKYGDTSKIMYRIDNGKIKPSKSLADSIDKMLKGNEEFIMIDDQKIVYETALALAKKSSDENKNVLIVEGGPGTGKSVVAINLLVKLTKLGLLSQYVTKNAAPRTVYEAKLSQSFKKSELSNFFTGSGSFINSDENDFDVLIVDEAHRLNEKSGMMKNLGENQIKEIINASKFSIFFIDEDQRVTLHDIGEKDEIKKWAVKLGAKVHSYVLTSQFRCNGSDGFLAWVDNALQIRETANKDLRGINFDFRIVDSPTKLRDLIFEKNKLNNKARMVAGYCWDWKSKKDKNTYDIEFPEHDFKMKWNLTEDGSLWIMSPNSVNEIGCIHTCQGLEVDYIGVIVGEDLIVRDGKVITDPSKRSKMDSSIRGYKKLLENDPVEGKKKIDRIIKNTYRTLMTRGMKGCYVYFVDKTTRNFFIQKF